MKDEKILQEEILSDEEFDQVVGGTVAEINDDVVRFRKVGIECTPFEYNVPTLTTQPDFSGRPQTLTKAFEKYGVKMIIHTAEKIANQYFIDGKSVSHEKAWEHIYLQVNK